MPGLKIIQSYVNAGQCVRFDNAFIRKVAYAYTVPIIGLLYLCARKPLHAFMAARNSNHVSQNHHHFVSKL